MLQMVLPIRSLVKRAIKSGDIQKDLDAGGSPLRALWCGRRQRDDQAPTGSKVPGDLLDTLAAGPALHQISAGRCDLTGTVSKWGLTPVH